MEISTCPICNLSVPSLELQRHANEHFDDEDYMGDFEFARTISIAPPSPPRFAENSLKCWPSSSRCDAKTTDCVGKIDAEKFASLVLSQNKEKFYRVEGNLMTMLRKCLELESGNSSSILCGHIDHFQSTEWDIGWGCGWRNIQMLSSHLLSQREEAKQVLYGGSGFVPNIGSVQRWLELAWEKGFDTLGSNEFDQKIHGKRNWIGTVECAALLRSFGLRACIVDFVDKDCELDTSVACVGFGKRKISQIYGPMDSFLSKGKVDSSPRVSSGNEGCKQVDGLTEWVWNYFRGNNASISSGNSRVVISEKTPLYFQHDGHSRTIVGIQVKHQKNGRKQYNLLIFDPSEKTINLEESLRKNVGWQRLIKRGAHTLRKSMYQLCYVDPGIAHGQELEKLKTIRRTRHEF